MKWLFVFLLFTIQISIAQKNASPQFYSPNFTMPENNRVKTDGFYVLNTIRFDTFYTITGRVHLQKEESRDIYQFFTNGSFYYRSLFNMPYKKIKRLITGNVNWIKRKQQKYPVLTRGFYKISGDTLLLEKFNAYIQYPLNGIFYYNYYRQVSLFLLSNGTISFRNDNTVKTTRYFYKKEIEFIASAIRPDTMYNGLLHNKNFLTKTGFIPQ